MFSEGVCTDSAHAATNRTSKLWIVYGKGDMAFNVWAKNLANPTLAPVADDVHY